MMLSGSKPIADSTTGFLDDNKANGFRDALLTVAGSGNLVDVRRLGNWLGRNKDRVVDGMKIVLAGIRNGTNYWQLLSASGSL